MVHIDIMCRCTKEKDIIIIASSQARNGTWLHLWANFTDQTVRRAYSLRPLGPAAIIQSPLLRWRAGLHKSSIDDCSSYTCSATADNGLRGIDTLRLEDILQLLRREKGLVFGVQQIGDWDGYRVWDVSG